MKDYTKMVEFFMDIAIKNDDIEFAHIIYLLTFKNYHELVEENNVFLDMAIMGALEYNYKNYNELNFAFSRKVNEYNLQNYIHGKLWGL